MTSRKVQNGAARDKLDPRTSPRAADRVVQLSCLRRNPLRVRLAQPALALGDVLAELASKGSADLRYVGILTRVLLPVPRHALEHLPPVPLQVLRRRLPIRVPRKSDRLAVVRHQ